MKNKKKKIACIIGRFQIDELHKGHKHFIKKVIEKSDELLIFLGSSDVRNTRRNPLNYETRYLYLKKLYPKAIFSEVFDNPSNEQWSLNLDQSILDLCEKHKFNPENITLYGAKDSFIPYYSGEFKTQIIKTKYDVSACDLRKNVQAEDSIGFRRGAIHSSQQKYPAAMPTVDIVCNKIVEGKQFILLGNKYGHAEWCLPGGFVDPSKDDSYTAAAKREFEEETSLILPLKAFIKGEDYKVNDFRYAKEEDKIFTTVFTVNYNGIEEPKGADDLIMIKWVPLDMIESTNIIDHHKMIIKTLFKI